MFDETLFFVWFVLALLFYLVVDVTSWFVRCLARTWREFWRDRSDECRRKN